MLSINMDFKITFAFVGSLIGILLVADYAEAQSSLERRRFSSLKADDNAQMQRQRSIVTRVVRDNFGYVKLQGGTSDIYYLQRILDKKLVQKHEAYDLQALGVILGDILAKNLSLQWVIVDDRYGRSRALRYGETDHVFFPITMISRRYQNNLAVNVRQLYKETETRVKEITYKQSKYQQVPGQS